MHARFQQAQIARIQRHDRHVFRHDDGFLLVAVGDGQGAAVGFHQFTDGAVGHGVHFAVGGFPGRVPFAGAAQAGGEHVHFQRFERAVRLRHGGGADKAVRFDIVQRGFGNAEHFGLIVQLDAECLALAVGQLQIAVGNLRDGAAHRRNHLARRLGGGGQSAGKQ